MLLFLFHNIPRTNHCPLNRTRTFPSFSRQPPLSETNRTIPVRRTSAPCILHAHTPASRLPYVRFPDFAIIRPRSIRQTASCSVNRTSTVLPSGSGSQKCHDCPKSSFSGLIIVFMYSSGTCFFRSGLFVRLRWGGVMNFSDGSDKRSGQSFFLFLQLRLHGANLFLSEPIVPTVPISARRFPILFDGCLLPRSTGFSLHVSWAIHQRI